MNLKVLVKELLPPALFRFVRGIKRDKSTISFEGDFNNWSDAFAECHTSGYAEHNILQKTLESVLAVKTGEVVFERDSVLFDEIKYSWPLLCAILLSAINSKTYLKILDFGGSLGSTYFQNKKFLDATLKKVIYGVVEQSHYVETGNEKISNRSLRFFYSIEEYLRKWGKPDILIFSGVLQYLSSPFDILEEALSKGVKYVCIDRTPIIRGGGRIMIQNVNKAIYNARLPHHFFEKKQLISFFDDHGYQVLECFDTIDNANDIAEWKGFIFVSKN